MRPLGIIALMFALTSVPLAGAALGSVPVLAQPTQPGGPPTQQVREQNLDANGNIKVHEQGTAKVQVMNASLPVATAGEPFQAEVSLSWSAGVVRQCGSFTVPAGSERLEIEYVSAQGVTANLANAVGIEIEIQQTNHFVPAMTAGGQAGSDIAVFTAGSQVRLYAPASATVSLCARRLDGSNVNFAENAVTMSVSGRRVDVP